MIKVSDVVGVLEVLAPPSLAADWDNVGLLVGDRAATVRKLLLCIDLTGEVLTEAAAGRAQMVMAYHPVIFKPLSRVTADGAAVVYEAARRGISVYSMHTALDAAPGGTNDVLADAMGLDRPRGVLIEEVLPETPAEAAGLMTEDIILDIDGRQVNRSNQVQSLIARRSPEQSVIVRIRRREKTLSLDVRLGERSGRPRVAATPERQTDSAEHFGLAVEDLTEETAKRIDIDGELGGVVVVDVNHGPARDAGFAPDDLILRIRQRGMVQDIRRVDDFREALERLEAGRNAAFVIVRGGARKFISMKIPDARD